MDTNIHAVRQALIDRRDAFQHAIDAFDAALGLGAIADGAPKSAARGNKQTNKQTNKARPAPSSSAEPP